MANLIKILTLFAVIFMLQACDMTHDPIPVIDDNQAIIAPEDSYTFVERAGSIDDQSAFIQFKGFEGSQTLLQFTGHDTRSITVSQHVTEGRFMVVLIDPYDVVTLLRETTDIQLSQGIYRIKIVGEGASGTVSINIQHS